MADCDEIICLDSDDSLDSAPVINITELPHSKQNITGDKSARQLSRLQPTAQKIVNNLARNFSLTSDINISVLASGEISKSTQEPPTSSFGFGIRHSTPAEVVKNTGVSIGAQKYTNNFVRNDLASSTTRSLASGKAHASLVAQNAINNFVRNNYSGSNKKPFTPGETIQNIRIPIAAQNSNLEYNSLVANKRQLTTKETNQNIRVPIVAQNTTDNFVKNNSVTSNKRHSTFGETVQVQNIRVPITTQTTTNNFVRNYSLSDKKQSPGETGQNTRVRMVIQNTTLVRNYTSLPNKRSSVPIPAVQDPRVIQNNTNYPSASDKRQSPVETAQKAMQDTNMAESTMAWSRNTSNFIKQTMTTAIKPTNKQILLPTPPTAHQSSYPQLSNARAFMQNNAMAFMSSQSIPYINVNPIHFEQGYYDQGILRNSFVPNNITNIPHTNNDFWMKVRLEDSPNRGEVVAQYYFDHATQTPIQIHNNPPQINSVLQTLDHNKECTNKKNLIATNKIQCQTLNSNASETLNNNNNFKKGKNIVPPFLKRNRSVTTPITTEISSQRSPANFENNEIIYVEEFSNIVSSTITSSESASTQEILQKRELIFNTGQDWEKRKTDESSNKITISNTVSTGSDKQCSQPAKRQKKSVPEPRRNPKRQVQIEKDYMKMLEDSIWEPEKENKGRGVTRTSKDKKVEKKSAKRSPRVQPTCGAIFSPPSPLTASHIRKWPTDGMHERPEYNYETGKIVKFDQLIRQIADDYQDKNKNQPGISIKDIGLDKDVPLSVLSHDVLHHVLSYVASMEKYKKYLKNGVNCNFFGDKIQFFEDLKLVPTTDKTCDTLNNNNTTSVDNNTDDFSVKDILKNNILLYSLTNNVDQADVAEYIETLNPEDIILFSNRKFGIDPDVEDLM